jgi:transposase
MKNELPDDIDQLKAMLRKQQTMLNDQQTRWRVMSRKSTA